MSSYDVDIVSPLVCICTCVWGKEVYVHLCVHMLLYELWHAHMETKDSLPLSFQHYFLSSVSLNLELTDLLDWLVSELQGSSCLSFVCRATSVFLLRSRGSKPRSLYSSSRHFAYLNHLPSMHYSFIIVNRITSSLLSAFNYVSKLHISCTVQHKPNIYWESEEN